MWTIHPELVPTYVHVWTIIIIPNLVPMYAYTYVRKSVNHTPWTGSYVRTCVNYVYTLVWFIHTHVPDTESLTSLAATHMSWTLHLRSHQRPDTSAGPCWTWMLCFVTLVQMYSSSEHDKMYSIILCVRMYRWHADDIRVYVCACVCACVYVHRVHLWCGGMLHLCLGGGWIGCKYIRTQTHRSTDVGIFPVCTMITISRLSN